MPSGLDHQNTAALQAIAQNSNRIANALEAILLLMRQELEEEKGG